MRSIIILLLSIMFGTVSCLSNINPGHNNLVDLDSDLPGDIPKSFAVGTVTTTLQDWGITMTADGTEFFYTATAINEPGNSNAAIVKLEYVNGKWSRPEVVSFSGRYKDNCPNISPDGTRMIFASRRPASPADSINDSNLWGVDRINGTWGEPYLLKINDLRNSEFFPTMAPSGDIFYCTNYSGRGNPVRIYHSKYVNGEYQKPEPIKGEILSDLGEYCPYILPDEKHMIIEIVNGPNGVGNGDMYISKKQEDGTWGKAIHLGDKINSTSHDCFPILTPDGKFLIFMSDRKPDFINDDGILTYNELLWSINPPIRQPFDFYWISADLLKEHL